MGGDKRDVLVSADRHQYRIVHKGPGRAEMDVYVKTKPWLEYESYDLASLVADYLYPNPRPAA